MVDRLHFFRQLTALQNDLNKQFAKLKKTLSFTQLHEHTEKSTLQFPIQAASNSSQGGHFPQSYLKYLQATIEQNHHLVLIIDSDYRCIAINREARQECKKFLDFDIHVGMDIREERLLRYPELRQMMQRWQKALEGEASQLDFEFAGVNEKANVYRLHLYPIRHEGEVIAAVAAGHNITSKLEALEQQSRLQDDLQLSHSKLQGIIQGARYAIAAVNADLELIEINEPAHQLLAHFTKHTVRVGDALRDMIGDDTFLSCWLRALQGEEFTRLQKVNPTVQSEEKHYEISFSSIRNHSGKLIGVTMMGRDMSKERLIEQELKDIKEFRFLAENVPQLIWITRADGEPEFYNERFLRYTGLNMGKLKNEQWRNLIHPDDLEEGMTIWNRALQTGQACEMEYRLKRAHDHTYRWHLVRSVPMKNEADEVTHWIGSATDIHERKLQTQQIADKNRQLERINKYMDDFVHTTAHDMRVPVARLQLLVDTFRELPPGEREVLLPKISRSVKHLDSTLRGLVQVIELQNTEERIEADISIRQVVEDILERQQEFIEKAQAVIRVHDDEKCEVRYIKSYLYTIISNLISNAIQYRSSSRTLQLDVHVQKKEGYCQLIFKDNGVGIDLKQYQKQLFKPFRRVNRQNEGIGLGLYVINTMLEKNGGYVEVESQPGKGSSFRIYLKEYRNTA
jgi:PAS domain S-box-containing protein